MALFHSLITDQGESDLIYALAANKGLQIAEVRFGSAQFTGTADEVARQAAGFTQLQNPVSVDGVISLNEFIQAEGAEPAKNRIEIQVKNTGLTQRTYVREIGLYTGEGKLFAYAFLDPEQGDSDNILAPSATADFADSMHLYSINIYLTKDENRRVEVTLSYSGLVTEKRLQQHNTDPQAHEGHLGDPLGTILLFPSQELPPGYLYCNGGEVGRSTYADLFDIIGTTYGEGDGATTFNLPDLRGQFVRGLDMGRGLDPERKLGEEQGDAIRNIRGAVHPGNVPGSSNLIISDSGKGALYADYVNVGTAGVSPTTAIIGYSGVAIDASRVVPTAEENRPVNLPLVFGIKAFGAVKNLDYLEVSKLAQDIANLTLSSVQPIGSILTYTSESAPEGYLRCDGRAISRTTYDLLYSIIGTKFGEGDGLSTFNLPDLRGEFLRDAGEERQIGEVQGDASRQIKGSIQHRQLTNKGGIFWAHNNDGLFTSGTIESPSGSVQLNTDDINTGLDWLLNFDTANVVPTAEENRPRNVAVMYYIKAYHTLSNRQNIDLQQVMDNFEQHKNDPVAHGNLYLIGQWQAQETVQEGYIRYPNNVDACNIKLACVQAGQTGGQEPVWGEIGRQTADNTAVWEVQSLYGGRDGVPVGSILLFPMNSLPTGFMPCDGTYLDRETYKDLYEVIGTKYGEGDGTKTFNLPDLRGYFVRGLDDGKGIDQGRELGSVQGDAMRNIEGSFAAGGLTAGKDGVWEGAFGATGAFLSLGGISNNTASVINEEKRSDELSFDASRVVPTAEENRPKNIALVYAIKVFGAATNTGEVDVAKLAASVAELTNTLQQPAGSVLAFAGKKPPSGYLVCDGGEVGRATYPDLFEAIGTIYGEGDGKETFNLPDLRGMFLRGLGGNSGELGEQQGDAIRNITGTFTGNLVSSTFSSQGAIKYIDSVLATTGTASDNRTFASSVNFDASLDVPTAEENRPVNMAILYCIKAFGSKTNVGQIDLTELANDLARYQLKKQVFTTSGVHDFTAPLTTTYKVTVVGGGAGGGGVQSNLGIGGGGGGGAGAAIKWVELKAGDTVPVTVGPGGTGGQLSTGWSGVSGGTSSFGSYCSATGGTGGGGGSSTSATVSLVYSGGGGGKGIDGDINLYGTSGTDASLTTGETVTTTYGGNGGSSAFAGGGADGGANGYSDAQGHSGGGSGGSALNAAIRGGHGAPGLVIIEW